MYQTFFGLKAEPFGVSPDPRFFYSSSQHAEAAASLYYAIAERRGFAALIAAPGLGKTSVLVSLLDRLRERADVVFLVHPKLDGETLLESVLTSLGVEPDADAAKRTRQLARHLSLADSRGRTCLVIIDEAQNLSADALESVRMLSNFEAPGRKLIQFVFAGQPALATLLKRPECEQIRQRISLVARLGPLSPTDIESYIHHRLRVAGATENPFTPAAIEAIAEASSGIPRMINTLCFSSADSGVCRQHEAGHRGLGGGSSSGLVAGLSQLRPACARDRKYSVSGSIASRLEKQDRTFAGQRPEVLIRRSCTVRSPGRLQLMERLRRGTGSRSGDSVRSV